MICVHLRVLFPAVTLAILSPVVPEAQAQIRERVILYCTCLPSFDLLLGRPSATSQLGCSRADSGTAHQSSTT